MVNIGEVILVRIPKSDSNPCRRYYRCAFAFEQKLSNDNHIFKWVDEASLDEIEALTRRTEKLEQIMTGSMEAEKKMFEMLEMKLEKENFERVEEVLAAAKSKMKKMMLLVSFGCMIVVGCTKLIG